MRKAFLFAAVFLALPAFSSRQSAHNKYWRGKKPCVSCASRRPDTYASLVCEPAAAR